MNRLNFRSHSNNSITRSIKSAFKTNKISLVISLLLLLILTIESCKKSKEDLPVISDPIELARIALADATKEQHVNIDTTMYRQSLRRTVLWEKALLRKIGDSTIVYAPIRLSKELTIKEGGQPGVSVNNISWLVVTKFKEKYKFDMVLRIPNKEAGTTGKFNGVLIVDDWFGKRQTFYIDKDKEKSNTSNRKDANGDVITTMGSSCRTTSYTICAGNDNYCYTTYETTCTYTSEPPINDDPYDPYGGDNPGGQVPGNGGGGGEGDSNQSIITNQIKDPCLNNVVNKALNGDIKGEITGILRALGESTKVDITITDVSSLPNGADDAINGQFIIENGVATGFNLTISLNLSNLHSSERTASQEFVAGTIIHEAIHAYFRVQTGTDEKMNEMDHQTMSTSYVAPMAEYLSGLYGVSNMDARSIVWRGLMLTDAYKKATVFDIGNGATVSKQDLQDMGVQYSLGILGKKLCD